MFTNRLLGITPLVNLLNPRKDEWVSTITKFIFDQAVQERYNWYKDTQSRSDILFTLLHAIDGLLKKGERLESKGFVIGGDRYNFHLYYKKELLYQASKDKGFRPFGGRDWPNLVTDILIDIVNNIDYGSIPPAMVMDAMVQLARERGIAIMVKS